jgi:hypothetical protein
LLQRKILSLSSLLPLNMIIILGAAVIKASGIFLYVNL